jgi:hypothetical protein
MPKVAYIEGLGDLGGMKRTCIAKYRNPGSKGGGYSCALYGKVPVKRICYKSRGKRVCKGGFYHAAEITPQQRAAIKAARAFNPYGAKHIKRFFTDIFGTRALVPKKTFDQLIKEADAMVSKVSQKQRDAWIEMQEKGGSRGRIGLSRRAKRLKPKYREKAKLARYLPEAPSVPTPEISPVAGLGNFAVIHTSRGPRCKNLATNRFAKNRYCGLGGGRRSYFRGLNDGSELEPADAIAVDTPECREEWSETLGRPMRVCDLRTAEDADMKANFGYMGYSDLGAWGGGGGALMPLIGIGTGGVGSIAGTLLGKKFLKGDVEKQKEDKTEFAGLIGVGVGALLAGAFYFIPGMRSAALPAGVVGGLYGFSNFLIDYFAKKKAEKEGSEDESTKGMGALVAEPGMGMIMAEPGVSGIEISPTSGHPVSLAGDYDEEEEEEPVEILSGDLDDEDNVIDVNPSQFGSLPIPGLQG